MFVLTLAALVDLLASSMNATTLDQLVAYFVFDCCRSALVLGMFVSSVVVLDIFAALVEVACMAVVCGVVAVVFVVVAVVFVVVAVVFVVEVVCHSFVVGL